MYQTEKLEKFAAEVMEKAGMEHGKALLFAESLIAAEKRGMKSHGLTRLKTYAARLEQGLVDAGAEAKILRDSPSFLLIDGANGLGVPTAMEAMQLCMARAKKTGACFAAVRGGNHFGIGAFFTEKAAEAGLIGIAMANGPRALAAIGGKEPILGTNPLSVSVPSAKYGSVNLDMATSVVARGKVTLAAKEGKEIPAGWAIDENGLPTTDPNKAKCMLPFGGPKGFGIGLLIEIFCSCLSGAKNGQTMGSFYDFSGKKQDSGFFLGAMDPEAAMPLELFRAGVDALCDSVKNSPRADGCAEIFLPGEIERSRTIQAEKEGISVSPAVLAELNEISDRYGVPFSCEI